MAAVTTTTTDTTTGDAKPRSWCPGRGRRRCPTPSCSRPLSCWERCSATRSCGSSPMSTQEYGLPQVFGQPAPWVGLDNFRTILEDAHLDRLVAHAHLLLRQRRPHDGAGGARRPAARCPRERDAVARVGVADRCLGDAGLHRDDRVAVDVRHRVRPRQLGARPQGELVGKPTDVLLRRHHHRGVDGHPVRRLHGLRRADADPRRHRRGREARRRRLPRHLPLRRLPR